MEKLVNLINQKASRYEGELFYCDGEFFAIYDGKIAKLPDFLGDFSLICRLKASTEKFINTYLEDNGLDASTLFEAMSVFDSDFEISGEEIPDGLDYDSFNFLISAEESGISPYHAYKGCYMVSKGIESGQWILIDRYGEQKSALEYIGEACELIDFAYTDEWDDEYWESIINNLECYLYTSSEIY